MQAVSAVRKLFLVVFGSSCTYIQGKSALMQCFINSARITKEQLIMECNTSCTGFRICTYSILFGHFTRFCIKDYEVNLTACNPLELTKHYTYIQTLSSDFYYSKFVPVFMSLLVKYWLLVWMWKSFLENLRGRNLFFTVVSLWCISWIRHGRSLS